MKPSYQTNIVKICSQSSHVKDTKQIMENEKWKQQSFEQLNINNLGFGINQVETSPSKFQPQRLNFLKISLNLFCDKEGWKFFCPEFHLSNFEGFEIMSAKMISSKPRSTFIISSDKYDFDENSKNYLGKIKSNLLGNILNIFGKGRSPSHAKQQNEGPRQLLATIVVNLFPMRKPRSFTIYMKKSEYNYCSLLENLQSEQETSLDNLYHHAKNKDKIIVFQSQKPEWKEEIKGYKLKYQRQNVCSSIKNFILEQNSSNLLHFGKLKDNFYFLDIYDLIDPFLAFAFSIASFDSRLLCQ